MIKKYTGLTPRILGHILAWGDYQSKNGRWTKSDSNVYALVQKEIKRIHHERYLKQRAAKANPYLDPSQPYHTT